MPKIHKRLGPEVYKISRERIEARLGCLDQSVLGLSKVGLLWFWSSHQMSPEKNVRL